ncbi:MAG: hypothetical protein M0Z79_12135 [Nitrospiraceae bacterium]|nr:hypothetical protein [Nitrospiraceae bacterium]
MSELSELIGKIVELGTPEMIYFGRLVEVNEEEVYLDSYSGWIVVPVDKVAYIREKDED